MTELIIYSFIFMILIGHAVMAFRMYRTVHANSTLSVHEKNSWKLKALVFPAYYWQLYKKLI